MSPSSMPVFELTSHKWEPLTSQRDEFRIVELLGTCHEDGNQVIEASIHNVPGSGHPPYVALSYSWGTHNATRKMLLDKCVFYITEHLHQALVTLVSHGVTNIWVDALCIDQTSPEEKAAQVQRMSTIFHEADSVMIWLGSSLPSIDRILQRLRNVDLSALDHKFWAEDFFRRSPRRAKTFSTAFTSFLTYEYWYRTWVIQEIAVAKQIVIFTDAERIDGAIFDSLFSSACWERFAEAGHQPWERYSIEDLDHIVDIWNIRLSVRERQPRPLLKLLCDVRICKTTLPIDRIYAIYSLAIDQKAFVTAPNYILQPSQLCADMTRRFIEVTGSLDIIFIGDLSSKRDLPSWSCPLLDFQVVANSEPERQKVDYIDRSLHRHRCGELGDFWNTTISDFQVNDKPRWEGQTLQVPGLRLGRVTGFNPSWATGTVHSVDQDTISSQLCTIFDSLCRLLMIHSPLYNNEDHIRSLVFRIFEYNLAYGGPRRSASKGPQHYNPFFKGGWKDESWRERGILQLAHYTISSSQEDYHKVLTFEPSSADLFDEMLSSVKNKAKSQSTSKITTEELEQGIETIMEHVERGLTCFLVDFESVGLLSLRNNRYGFPPLEVWLLAQCSKPVLLEPVQPADGGGQVRYRVYQEALIDRVDIHGRRCSVMDGEAWKAAKREDFQLIDII